MIETSRRVLRGVLARPALADFLLFLLMGASLSAEFIAFRSDFRVGLSSFQLMLWFALTIPVVVLMLFRRLAPFAVFAAVTAIQLALLIVLGSDWLPSTFEWCLYITVYTVASRRTPRWSGTAVALASLTLIPLRGPVRCPCMIQLFTFLSFAAIAGFSLQTGRRLIGELRWQAGVLQRMRGERVKLALTQQRSQVARDLHDVVAHGVTVMVVQAGAARMLASTDTRRAQEILARVESVAGESVRDLRALVASLSSNENAPLEDLPSLIKQERSLGLEVDFSVAGDPRPIGSAMEISLYRIVQEALTNVRKHAPGATARVVLRYLTEVVEVDVTNDAPRSVTPTRPVVGFGRGLIGVRERAALFGGEASAGPTPDGGFRVSARLPLELVPV